MANDMDPMVGNWYVHLDKGQKFEVVAVDEDSGVVGIQHFDGDLEEVSVSDWGDMEIELCEEPQNWTGPIDVEELDDLGTEITDTTSEDWSDPLEEFRDPEQEKLTIKP